MEFLDRFGRQGRHVIIVLTLILVFTAGVFVGTQQFSTVAQTPNVGQANPNTLPPVGADERFAVFWEVYNLIQKNYIEVPDEDALINGAINGLIESLDDQFSGYTEPEFHQFADSDLSGEIQGIGVVISQIEDTELIEVVNVLEGTPAQAAGVREGDIFLEVEGEDVTGFTTSQLAARVRGPEGTVVNIKFLREEEELDFAIERARIRVPNFEYRVIDDSIGYIKLNQFTVQARSEIDEALQAMNPDSLEGLIVDFRGNPGGLLSSAVNVASAFVEDGVILYEDFGDGTEQVFEANGTFTGFDKSIVVLVDERSASASELVAGAWQDRDVATVLGVVTFGKGTVQTQSDLTNGGGLRLTIARWLTPNRNWIHEQGITPDIVIEWDSEARTENPEDDPQLEAALEFLKTGEAVSQ